MFDNDQCSETIVNPIMVSPILKRDFTVMTVFHIYNKILKILQGQKPI